MRRNYAFLFSLLWGACLALMPPHSDFLENEEYQSHQLEWQRRLSAEEDVYDDLQLLHPDMCRHVSVKDCLEADEFTRNQALSTRKLVESTGTFRALVLLMQFPNHRNRALPSVSEVRQVLTGRGTDPVLYPTGSVTGFLKNNSINQLDIQMDIMDWRLTKEVEAHYAKNRSGLDPGYMKSFNSILDQLDGTVNWDDYDRDGDGYIDSLIVLHSGYGAERSGGQCDDDPNNKNRIWSHAVGWVRANTWQSKDGRIQAGTYMTTSVLHARCSNEIFRIGTSAHELMHTWGVPDLYDSSWTGKGTGAFDIMSHPYGLDGSSLYPAYLGAWSRLELGWIKPKVITRNGRYSLTASQSSGQVYRIDEGFPEDEYLLIENRQPILWDSLLWKGGILIWHIDKKARKQKFRGYPGQEGWPGNGFHYHVAVVQADSAYHLERGENLGFTDDFFYTGRELKPGPGVDVAIDASLYPNSDSYQLGVINVTGIRIFDFSESQHTMTFSVSGLAPAIPTPSPVPATPFPTPSPTPQPPRPTVTPTMYPTLTPVPTEEPYTPSTTMPSTSMQPAASSSSGVNVDLAIALTLLFACLFLVAGYYLWRLYFNRKKNAKEAQSIPVIIKQLPGTSDDNCDSIEVSIPWNGESGKNNSAEASMLPLEKQISLASTATATSSIGTPANADKGCEQDPSTNAEEELLYLPGASGYVLCKTTFFPVSPFEAKKGEAEGDMNESGESSLQTKEIPSESASPGRKSLSSYFDLFATERERSREQNSTLYDEPSQSSGNHCDIESLKPQIESPLSYMDLALRATRSTDTNDSSQSDDPRNKSATDLFSSFVIQRQNSVDSAASSPSAFQ